MQSSNPALTRDPFSRYHSPVDTDKTMTLSGCINKAGFLILLVIFGASLTWQYIGSLQTSYGQPAMPSGILWGSLIGGLILAMIIIFKPTTAPFLSPVYALIEGALLGAISMFMEIRYPGIAMQAVVGTFGVFALMLFTYRTGLIKVTEKFRSIMMMAVGGIFLIYMVSFLGSLFGFNLPYIHEGGPIGIGFSVVVCGIAAFSLLLDFDLIEKGAQQRAPKFMEWYAAFSLLVTLIWLYLEILRLLGKSRK